jgi:hypothetical protein
MPNATDMFPSLLQLDHNPLNQLIDDPTGLWDELTSNIGQNITTTIPDSIESEISEALTGSPNGLADIETWAESIPIIGPLITAILGGTPSSDPTTAAEWEAELSTYFSGLEQMLGMPDFTSGTFDATTAVDTFITNMLGPTGQLAMLTEGLLNDLNIPGLDASKIVSGLFPQSMVTDLETDFATVNAELSSAQADLASLGTLLNDQLGGTASTVDIITGNGATVVELNATGTQGTLGFTGLHTPCAMCYDTNDNLYVVDSTNAAVYMMTPAGVQSTLGFTGLHTPCAVAVDSLGGVYVADSHNAAVYQLAGPTQQTLGFSGLTKPVAVALDGLGQIYVADQTNAAVYKLAGVGGSQSTIGFTGLSSPNGVAVDILGNVYVSDNSHNQVYKLPIGGGGQETLLALTHLTGPGQLALDSSSNLYIADASGIYELSSGDTASTIGFTGLSSPLGIAVTNADWAYILAALQQLTGGASDTNWDTLLSDLDLPDSAGLAEWLSTLNTNMSSTWSTLTGEVDADLTQLGTWATNLLDGNSALNSNNLFGQISADLMALIPVSHIGQPTASPNLVSDPNFTSLSSVGGSVYTQDSTQTYNGIAGSAKVTADGTGPKSLLSNLIPVAPGQALNVSAEAQWTALTSTALSEPFVLGVNYYSDSLGADLLSQPVIAQLAASPDTSTWQTLSGASTAPANAASVRLRFDLLASATAGTGWFTAANLSKGGLLPASLSSFSGGGTVDSVIGAINALIADIQSDISALLPQSDFTALIAALGGGTEVTQVVDWVDTLLTGQSTLDGANLANGSVPTAAVPDFGTLFTNIVNQVLGQGGSGYGQTNVLDAFSHQADVITGQSSTITSLQSQLTALQASLAGAPVVTDTDTFLRFNSANLGANWSQKFVIPTGAGSYGTAFGISASWNAQGVVANTVINQWVGANQNSNSDTQEITIVLSSQGVNGSTPSYIDVLGRMSSDKLNFIRLRFGADGSVYVSRVIAGAETVILSNPPGTIVIPPGMGARLTLLTGIPGVVRNFQGFLNGNQVISTPDTTSLYGTAYRGWGFGAAAGVEELFGTPIGQATPANVSQWTAIG